MPTLIPKLKKPVSEMSEAEKDRLREKVLLARQKAQAKLDKSLELAKEYDPFLAYVPNDGSISKERMEFLLRHFREEDIPVRFQGQTDVHKSTADIKLISGGNRASKSVTTVIEDYIQGTGLVPDSMQGWYPKEKLPTEFPRYHRMVGVDDHQLENTVLPAYRHWCPREFLLKGSWDESWSAKSNTLTLYKNKKPIAYYEFMTNKQDVEKFQGPMRHRINYDEEPLKAIWDENLMRFGTSPRINIYMAWTPTKGFSWAYELVQDPKDNTELFQLVSVVNPYVNLEVMEQIVQEINADRSKPDSQAYKTLKMRVLGEFISLSGLVYGGLFDRAAHIIDPFEITWEGHFIVRGLDPHLVKPTTCVEVAVDRWGMEYVVGCYQKAADTQEVKDDLAERARIRGYRLGWTQCDKSADSTIHALSDRNIFRELGRGRNAIPALDTSDKYTGSIHAGVDEIKQKLKDHPLAKRPTLYVFNIPENKPLITAFETMERDTYANEDRKGPKDRINEGKYDAHAALRYIHQRHVRWMPPAESVPEYVPDNAAIGY